MKLKFWFKPLLIVSALSLCFFYVWGCSFGSSSGGTVINPLGPDNSNGLSPSWAEEEAVITKRTETLVSNLVSKNVAAAAENFSENKRDEFLTLFQANIEDLPTLANVIKDASMSDLTNQRATGSRLAELSVQVGTLTYHIMLIKENGQWLFSSL